MFNDGVLVLMLMLEVPEYHFEDVGLQRFFECESARVGFLKHLWTNHFPLIHEDHWVSPKTLLCDGRQLGLYFSHDLLHIHREYLLCLVEF